MFEHIIVERLEIYLWTNDNQLGTKSGHSTDLCIYALTEFIEYFKSRSTSVYVAFLHASKAFDKISHWTLVRKLIHRGVPLYLVMIFVLLVSKARNDCNNNNNNNNNNRVYTPLSEKCSQSRVFISQCHMNHIIQY